MFLIILVKWRPFQHNKIGYMTEEVLQFLCSSAEDNESEDNASEEPEDDSEHFSQDGDTANMETIGDLCELSAEMEIEQHINP